MPVYCYQISRAICLKKDFDGSLFLLITPYGPDCFRAITPTRLIACWRRKRKH